MRPQTSVCALGALVTKLHEKMPLISKAEYMDLASEVVYWLQQPEVLEAPTAFALATRTGNIMESLSLFEDTHLVDEMHKNVWQL